MNISTRIGIAAAATVVAAAGITAVVTPVEAKTRVAQVLEFELDPTTTGLVASDPGMALTQLGMMVPFDGTWFTMRSLNSMGKSVRQMDAAHPCLSGSIELSSNDTMQMASWTVAPSCSRTVPEFRQVTRKQEISETDPTSSAGVTSSPARPA